MRQTLTTQEVALWLRINPGSVARWARGHGVTPLRQMRIGRSYVTVWSILDLARATRPPELDQTRRAC